MNHTNFLNASKEICLKAYPEMFLNAQRHYRVAKLISSSKEYGMAISHIILGAEELVKGLILYLDGIGFTLRSIAGAKSFLVNHRTKHGALLYVAIMSFIMKKSINAINKFNHGKGFEENILYKAKEEGDQSKMDRILSLLVKHRSSSINTVIKVVDFCMDADHNKMKGFYVDFDGELITPNYADESMFLNATITFRYLEDEFFSLIKLLEGLSFEDKNELIATSKSMGGIEVIMEQIKSAINNF